MDKLDLSRNLTDFPVARVIDLAKAVKSTMGLYISKLCRDLTRLVDQVTLALKQKVVVSTSSRMFTYRTMNPGLNIHDIYVNGGIPEHARIAFTRIRLSSHRLKIETDRWSCIEQDARLCTCGHVRTEEHVLL